MPSELPIRRNTALLSAALAGNSGTLQLNVAGSTAVLARGRHGHVPAFVAATAEMADATHASERAMGSAPGVGTACRCR